MCQAKRYPPTAEYRWLWQIFIDIWKTSVYNYLVLSLLSIVFAG